MLAEAIKDYKKGPEVDALTAITKKLEEKQDPRVGTIRNAAERWPRLDVVDASFTGT